MDRPARSFERISAANTRSAATASNRFRAPKQFSRRTVDGGHLDVDPMAKMPAPHVPTQPVNRRTEPQVKALLATSRSDASGSPLAEAFEDRRDEAIIGLRL